MKYAQILVAMDRGMVRQVFSKVFSRHGESLI
jgi:hypothetical protein